MDLFTITYRHMALMGHLRCQMSNEATVVGQINVDKVVHLLTAHGVSDITVEPFMPPPMRTTLDRMVEHFEQYPVIEGA